MPPQVLFAPFGVLFKRPAGRASLKDNPESEALFPFVMVYVKLVVPFRTMFDAPNAFAI